VAAFEPASPASSPVEQASAAAFEWSPAAEEPQPSSPPQSWDVRSEASPAADIGWDAQGDTGPGEAFAWEGERAESPPPADAAPAEPDWFTPVADPHASTRLMEPVLESGDPLGGAPQAAQERSFGEFALDADLEAGAGFGDAVLDPEGARDHDVSSSDLGASFSAAASPAPASSPMAASPPSRHSPAAAAAAPALPAAERRELHDALEKLAWEAFGPVAESLVREAVERIERIAWEVIPQMAEAVIREEIRKLKGE